MLARTYLALKLDALAAKAVAAGLALDSSIAELHARAGQCKRRAGEQAEAENAYRRALSLDPDCIEAKVDLCQLLCSTARPEEALDLVTGRPRAGPADRRIQFATANVYVELGRLDDARSCLEKFLEASPNHPEALMNLGVIEFRQSRDEQALASFRAAHRIKPEDPEISLNLAAALGRAGRHTDAIDLLGLLELEEVHAPRIFSLLADLHASAGNFDKAVLCITKATTLDLSNPEYYCRLGVLLLETGRLFDAIEALNKSLSIRQTPVANRALGVTLLRAFRPAEAVLALEAAHREMPDDVDTSIFLSTARRSSLNSDATQQLSECRRLVEEHPEQALAHSNLLFNLSFDEHSSPETYLAEALKFDESLRRVKKLEPVVKGLAGLHASRPLRLGFVSADFRDHPVGYFFEALAAEIDADSYQLFGYSNSPTHDDLTSRIRSRFASWNVVRFLDDRGLAELIRSHGIDILFDLSGHTSLNRLSMFAYRPAPIQATWLGYWASTGLKAIDYVVADPISVPPEHENHFCEQVIRMPVTRLCYGNSLPERPPVAPAPSVANGYVTFGCFQALHKITDTVISAWRQIMEAAPECRLRIRSLQFADRQVLETARERWSALGLPLDRTELLPPLPHGVYLNSYSEVDVALDTFPYPGGTTTTQAIWMGVPTLTMEGETMLARQGMALMSAAGLPEWVTRSVDEYIEKALQVCAEPAHIATLRLQLRQRVKASPLFDARQFARDFETMVESMLGEQEGTCR